MVIPFVYQPQGPGDSGMPDRFRTRFLTCTRSLKCSGRHRNVDLSSCELWLPPLTPLASGCAKSLKAVAAAKSGAAFAVLMEYIAFEV